MTAPLRRFRVPDHPAATILPHRSERAHAASAEPGRSAGFSGPEAAGDPGGDVARSLRDDGVVAPRNESTRRAVPGSPFAQPAADLGPAPVYQVGDRVTHDRHGMGKVVLVG